MNKDTQKELLRTVKKNYEDDARTFDETREKPIWPPLLALLKKVGQTTTSQPLLEKEGGTRVLDVGCGNGRLLKILAEANVKYVGVDQSESLIKICQEKYPEYKFAVQDILNLGALADFDFDYVFCIAVLHHLPGAALRQQALRQLKNKIKPGGKIILSVWNMWPQKKYSRMFYKFSLLKICGRNKMDFGDVLFDWRAPGGMMSKRYYHLFFQGELKKLVKKAGLKIENFIADNYNYYLVLTK
jgi:2-polyprenyl-3-methyl-5-hydroxy-6-metoxy-1,4-benzoquinol methylase